VGLTPDGLAAALHLAGFGWVAWLGRQMRAAGAGLSAPRRRAIALFGLAWMALFASSAAFHMAPPGRWREALAVADEGAIVLAIAAAWTPLAPFRLSPREARRFLAAIWGLALVLLVLTAWAARDDTARRALSWGYLAHALAPGILYGRTILSGFSRPLLGLLFASTLFYGGGLMLYLRPELVWAHAGWHAAVLAGCLCNHAALGRLIAAARQEPA
jgi:hemolysin III